eukprot:GFUD01032621.1.p1 GENE.GFUD01032621.1~~GFUD01032621.1.p1  ORF type:complete len:278 (-),score=53.51 GFUD01032621.1:194-919(-)
MLPKSWLIFCVYSLLCIATSAIPAPYPPYYTVEYESANKDEDILGVYCKTNQTSVGMSPVYKHMAGNMFLLYKDRTFPRTAKWIFAEDVAGDILRLAKDYNDARPDEGRGKWEKEESWKDYPDYWLIVTPGKPEADNGTCGDDSPLIKEESNEKDYDYVQSSDSISKHYADVWKYTNGEGEAGRQRLGVKNIVAKKNDNFLPIYVGGSIAVMILFVGFIIGIIIVNYPYCKFSNWLGGFVQ